MTLLTLQQQAYTAVERFESLQDELDRQYVSGSYMTDEQIAEAYGRMAKGAEQVRRTMQAVADEARRRIP